VVGAPLVLVPPGWEGRVGGEGRSGARVGGGEEGGAQSESELYEQPSTDAERVEADEQEPEPRCGCGE